MITIKYQFWVLMRASIPGIVFGSLIPVTIILDYPLPEMIILYHPSLRLLFLDILSLR